LDLTTSLYIKSFKKIILLNLCKLRLFQSRVKHLKFMYTEKNNFFKCSKKSCKELCPNQRLYVLKSSFLPNLNFSTLANIFIRFGFTKSLDLLQS